MKRLLLAFLLCLLPSLAQAASCTSYPFTLQNNTTADATQVMANFNTVRNCIINNAAGSGVNTDITSLTGLITPLSVAQGGTPVFIGGTSTGTANAQVVSSTTPTSFSLVSGYRVTFTAGATNTAATTLNANSSGATAVNRLSDTGLQALTGGEIVSGNIVEAIYNGSVFVLLSPTAAAGATTRTNIATGATVDLGTVPSHNARITSSGGTITSFGSSAMTSAPVYLISFAGANTLTYNATALLIPGAANITTAANDSAVVEYLGSGNWQVLSYTKSSGATIVNNAPLCGFNKLLATNNAGTPNSIIDVTAASFSLINPTGNVPLYGTAASFSINLTTGVGGTSTANGMDGVAPGNNNFVNLYVISNGSATAGLGSASTTAPTMPSGYTYLCRFGVAKTNGAGNLYGFALTGNAGQYVVGGANLTALPAAISNTSATNCDAANTTYTAATVRGTTGTAVWVPSTATGIALVVANSYGGGTSSVVNVAPNASYTSVTNSPRTGSNPPPVALDSAAAFVVSAAFRLESNNIYYCSGSNGGAALVLGWTDSVNAN